MLHIKKQLATYGTSQLSTLVNNLIHQMESYTGAVQTPKDAIILLEASRIGLIPRIKRRLKDTERASIKAGDVFIWNEKEAKMRRWTDGRSWSASRVTGAFLTYREMESVGSKKKDNRAFANIRISQDVYPQLATLMQTASRSSSTVSSPSSSSSSSSSPPAIVSSPTSVPSPLQSPQQWVAPSLTHQSISIPRYIPSQSSLPSVSSIKLPPIHLSLTSTPHHTLPSLRTRLVHTDAMALRNLDSMSFK
ncbi:cAMP-independent regulatory protein pac2 [Cyberlindnera fabianii]|uniref:cAMP-independent regulatory protein pac2 n=1 Tax=Cyberlindnera fabianii TaxID=36022 RepID=A0A1V2L124_CYBFA|nr:cAMP-independent regulatory protein pac2 [Cyberlindnera fabianii]